MNTCINSKFCTVFRQILRCIIILVSLYCRRLSLYPNEMINGHCYISLYLATAKSSVPSLRSMHSGIRHRPSSIYNGISDGEHVYATFRLFVFDQTQQEYFTVEGEDSAIILFLIYTHTHVLINFEFAC